MKRFYLLIGLICFLIGFSPVGATDQLTVSIEADQEVITLTGASNPNPTSQLTFSTEGVPSGIQVTSMALNYTQAGTSPGLMKIIDIYSGAVLDGKLLNVAGAQSSTRGSSTIQSWLHSPNQNLGLLLQGSELDADVSLANITLTINYVVPDQDKPVILTMEIRGIDTNSARIYWESNEPVSTILNYGKTSSYGQSTSDVSGSVSGELLITNLTPGTTYHFQLQISDSAGNTAQTQNQTFITDVIRSNTNQIVGEEVLSTPRLINAGLRNEGSSYTIEVSWSPSKSANIDGYIVYRSINSSKDFQELTKVGPSTLRYSDSNTAGATSYFYEVRAYKGNQLSQSTKEVSVFVPQVAGIATGPISRFRESNTLLETVLILFAMIFIVASLLFLSAKSLSKFYNKSLGSHPPKNILHDPEYYWGMYDDDVIEKQVRD